MNIKYKLFIVTRMIISQTESISQVVFLFAIKKIYVRGEHIMIGDRIREFRRNKGMNSSQLAKVAGLSQGALSDIENNNRKPSCDTLEKLIKTLEVDANWLFEVEESLSSKESILRIIKENNKYFEPIEIGIGGSADMSFREAAHGAPFVPLPLDLQDDKVFGAVACDDSMATAIKTNTIFFVDQRDKTIRDGHIYCLDLPDVGLVIRRLYKVPGSVRVVPDNKAFPEFQVSYEELTKKNIIVGRARFKAESLD